MTNTIKLKRGSGSDPSASDMVVGEPVLRSDTAELFFKKDDGSVAKVSGGGGGSSGTSFKYLALRNAANDGAASYPGNDFTLVTSGTTTAVSPTTANALIVSYGGVVQKPNSGTSTSGITGFIIDGSRLKTATNFAAAPDFIIYQESAGIGTPSDGTVSESKLNVSNSPTNGYFLQAQSGNTGGLTWAQASVAQIAADDTTVVASESGSNQYIKIDMNGTERYRFSGGNSNGFFTDQVIRLGSVSGSSSTGMQLNGTSTDSKIALFGSGAIKLISSTNAGDDSMAVFNKGGSAELYEDGDIKFQTTSTGVSTTGRLNQQVNSSTTYPTSFGTNAYTPYDHELVIHNNTDGNEGSFAGIYFNAGADSDGSKVGTARISAVETGNYKADLVFGTRNTSFTEKFRIEADGDFRFSSDTAATNYGWIRGWQPSTGDMIISADHSATGTGTSKSNLIFRSRGQEKLRIQSDGKVGIGTTSPTGIHSLAKVLEISGGDGGDLIIGNNASSNIGAGAHIGAIAFKNIDSSTGSVPHYAGIRCEATDTAGNMDLRLYTGIANLEADTPQFVVKVGGSVDQYGSQYHLYNNANTSNTYFVAQNTGAGNAGIKMKNTNGEWTIIANDRLRFIDDDAGLERLAVDSSGQVLFSGLTANNDGRNAKGISLKSTSGISFEGRGSDGSRNWRIRPDDMHAWGALDFAVSPTANSNSDWPDVAGDVVLALEGSSKDVVVKNGNLKIGTAGKGINFSAYATSGNPSSNLLDDYEIGTFTPAITSGLAGTPTYSIRTGHYVKIGNKVHLDFYIRINDADANGSHYYVGGFPFNIKGANYVRGGGCSTYFSLNCGAGGDVTKVVSFYGRADNNAAEFYQGNTAVQGTNGVANDGLYVIGFFEYITDET